MSFIRKIIGPDEKFIGLGRVHWIYALKGFAWILGLMAVAFVADRILLNFIGNFETTRVIGNYFFWCAAAVGSVLSFFYFIMWIATEIGLTDKRVIYKRGLIFVDVKEVDLEEIKAAEIDSGFLGRFLNYGYVYFDARFIDNVSLPAIDDPYLLFQFPARKHLDTYTIEKPRSIIRCKRRLIGPVLAVVIGEQTDV